MAKSVEDFIKEVESKSSDEAIVEEAKQTLGGAEQDQEQVSVEPEAVEEQAVEEVVEEEAPVAEEKPEEEFNTGLDLSDTLDKILGNSTEEEEDEADEESSKDTENDELEEIEAELKDETLSRKQRKRLDNQKKLVERNKELEAELQDLKENSSFNAENEELKQRLEVLQNRIKYKDMEINPMESEEMQALNTEYTNIVEDVFAMHPYIGKPQFDKWVNRYAELPAPGTEEYHSAYQDFIAEMQTDVPELDSHTLGVFKDIRRADGILKKGKQVMDSLDLDREKIYKERVAKEYNEELKKYKSMTSNFFEVDDEMRKTTPNHINILLDEICQKNESYRQLRDASLKHIDQAFKPLPRNIREQYDHLPDDKFQRQKCRF